MLGVWIAADAIARIEDGVLDETASRHLGAEVVGVREVIGAAPAASWYRLELGQDGELRVADLGEYGPGGTFPLERVEDVEIVTRVEVVSGE